jgi:NAD(P)-dependent dehydrogenase (short-subunit alcohol dehydrogenase family)
LRNPGELCSTTQTGRPGQGGHGASIRARRSVGEFAEEVGFVHAVLEGFAAVDEDYGDFVGELAAELFVAVDVYVLPGEAAAAVQLGEGLFDDFAKMTSFAGVDHDLAQFGHRREFSKRGWVCSSGLVGLPCLPGRTTRAGCLRERCAGSGTIPFMRMTSDKLLKGKTVLITGGARRLGRAIALAAAGAGADVAITFLHSGREAQHAVIDLSSFGVRAVALRCDITDEKSVKATIKEIGRELGGLDILVNNAANYETVEFERLSLKQWDAIFASNARGPFLVSREALKLLRERRGKIINMGSLGGLRPWADHAHYCSSKAAVHMLTKVMAKALAPAIAVNCVAPGMIDLGEKSAAAFMKRMAKQTPMQRNGTGEEIAAAVLFFATAPHFITGQIMAVDGGLGL